MPFTSSCLLYTGTAYPTRTHEITRGFWQGMCCSYFQFSVFKGIRDPPFNLKGGYDFLFRSEFFFRTTQELEYLFFLSEFNIRLYDKNSESDYFFFLHQNQNFFFSNIGNQNIFLEKNHNLQVKWSFPYIMCHADTCLIMSLDLLRHILYMFCNMT